MVVSADLSSRCALINEEMFGNRARLLFLRPEPFPGTTGEWKPQMTVTVVCETIPYWFLRLLLQQQQCVALFGNGGGNGGSQISANISKGRDCFCSMALPVDLLRSQMQFNDIIRSRNVSSTSWYRKFARVRFYLREICCWSHCLQNQFRPNEMWALKWWAEWDSSRGEINVCGAKQ